MIFQSLLYGGFFIENSIFQAPNSRHLPAEAFKRRRAKHQAPGIKHQIPSTKFQMQEAHPMIQIGIWKLFIGICLRLFVKKKLNFLQGATSQHFKPVKNRMK